MPPRPRREGQSESDPGLLSRSQGLSREPRHTDGKPREPQAGAGGWRSRGAGELTAGEGHEVGPEGGRAGSRGS